MEINEVQKKAIEHNSGPMLVLAGPGSGKTLVITRRTQQLIEQHGVKPERILVITFTKAAAEEMRERFFALMQEENTGVNFGTFHAIFFKILKYAYHYRAENILRDEERYRYLREIVDQCGLTPDDEKEFLEGISSEISRVKGERIQVEHYYSMNCSEESFQQIYKAYEARLRSANQIDFDDMMLLCHELLAARADILSFWQQRYEYILIDEFQDINQVQYDVIRLLSKPQDNLFIVGDDDQSIYRFRGAKPEIMLHFERDYPEAIKILLPYNYRSKSNIVLGALRVVKNNNNRFEKDIKAVQEPGEQIKYYNFDHLKQENIKLVEEVRKYYESGIPYAQMAILVRTNTQPRALVEKLMEYNIPFYMKDMIPNLYDHWISENIFAYIQLAKGNFDRSLFLKIMNRPKRYISRESVNPSPVNFNLMKQYYQDKHYVVERLAKLEYDLQMLKNMDPYAAIVYIRRAIGYEDYLKEYASFRRMKVQELFDPLDELQENARAYATYDEWFSHIEDYREELKRQTERRKKREEDGVAIMTFHGAKGLEYQVVFITDANEGITPHHKAAVLEDMEEERRMFYVAMTRAKEFLHIYSVKERFGKEFSCSRFVGEFLLDRDLLVKNSRVLHKSYGKGVITNVLEDRISIKFDRFLVKKTLDLEFCIRNQMLQIISE